MHECQQKIAAFVQQVQQGGGGFGRGDDGMRLGGGGRGRGMGLSSDRSDAETSRYIRTQGLPLPGGRAGVFRAMMGGGGGGSYAPFARYPPSEFGMDTVPDRMGGAGAGAGMWPPEQGPTGGLQGHGVGGPMTQGLFESGGRDRQKMGGAGGGMWPPEQGGIDGLGVGGPMTQGMFESGEKDRETMGGGGTMWQPLQQRPSGGVDGLGTEGRGMFDGGGRDRDADLRPSDHSASGQRMQSADHRPPTDLAAPPDQQQQQQYRSMETTPVDVSRGSKPRSVRFADEQSAKQQPKPQAAVESSRPVAHDLGEDKVCSVCQHSERGSARLSVFLFHF